MSNNTIFSFLFLCNERVGFFESHSLNSRFIGSISFEPISFIADGKSSAWLYLSSVFWRCLIYLVSRIKP